jgi:hypothetical protein
MFNNTVNVLIIITNRDKISLLNCKRGLRGAHHFYAAAAPGKNSDAALALAAPAHAVMNSNPTFFHYEQKCKHVFFHVLLYLKIARKVIAKNQKFLWTLNFFIT